MSEIKQKIRTVMAAVFEMDVKDIPDDVAPEVVEEWDSLRHMNLVLALEEEFNIRFPDEQIEQLINIEQIEFSINELDK
jgi:acyl carrier protein